MLLRNIFDNQIYSLGLDTFMRSNKDVPYFGTGTRFDIAALAEAIKAKKDAEKAEEYTGLEIKSETDETSEQRKFSVFDRMKQSKKYS